MLRIHLKLRGTQTHLGTWFEGKHICIRTAFDFCVLRNHVGIGQSCIAMARKHMM